MVVLDTSALLYWTLDPEKLTAVARRAIDEADKLVITSISVWEISLKVKRNRLKLPLPVTEYAQKLQRLERLQILPVDVETWLANVALEWAHRDPADRTIVATAVLLDSPLITSDKVIRDFYPQSIW